MYSGRNQLGHEYTIYEVEAAREDGRLIDEKLRSFRALPIGQVIEVSIEPFHSEAHGKSFTLHPTQSTSPGGTEQINEALKLLREMREMFPKLEERVEALEGKLATLENRQPPPQTGKAQQW